MSYEEDFNAVMDAITVAKKIGKPDSFNHWVEVAEIEDKPVGDFLGDAREDDSFPTIENLGELIGYLKSQDACRGCLDCVPEVWAAYEAWRKTEADLLYTRTGRNMHGERAAFWAERFGRLNGWRPTYCEFGLWQLARAKRRDVWRDGMVRGCVHELHTGTTCSFIDHAVWYRDETGLPMALATQPYLSHGRSFERLHEWFDEEWGLRMWVPQMWRASWHYPNGTFLIVIVRAGANVRWLPELSEPEAFRRLCDEFDGPKDREVRRSPHDADGPLRELEAMQLGFRLRGEREEREADAKEREAQP